MRAIHPKLVGLLMAALCVGSAIADEASTVKAATQASMNQYMRSYIKGDYAGANKVLRSVFSEDAVIVPFGGKPMKREQWIKENQAQMAMVGKIEKMELKIDSLTIQGNKGTSHETFRLVATMKGMQAPKQKPPKMEVESASVTNWEKRKGKWWMVKSVDKSQKMLVNGKPFNPGSQG